MLSVPFDRHVPFYLAAAAGVAGLALGLMVARDLAFLLAANAFFAIYLALTLIGLPHLTTDYLRKHAASSDIPVWIIFLITIGTVAVALVSLFAMINREPEPGALHLALALAAVPLGWLTIHMMAAIHYAHVYWQPDGETDAPAAGRRHRRGLDFPGTPDPRGVDFVYFAYVIGMTAQTSDVAISTRNMRKINTVHAVVSFFFNTVLVAAAVNLAVALGHP